MALSLSLALPLMPQKAFAWGDLGHEVVGEIAEYMLSRDTTTMNSINSIIGIEPMRISATWPDKIRDDARFKEFANFHFCTHFRDPNKKAEQDLTTVFTKYPPMLIDPAIAQAQQAIALRFIIHMVGDAHQPLHVGNEFDRGANSCTVQVKINGSNGFKSNLHKAWDSDILYAMNDEWKKANPSIKYFGAKEIANILMNKYPDLLNSSLSITPDDWMKESLELGKSGEVYPDKLPEDQRPYCQKKAGDLQPQEIPVLDANYYAKSRVVIEKQLVKGGVRLALYLRQILYTRRSPIVDESRILNDLLKKNDVKPTKAN